MLKNVIYLVLLISIIISCCSEHDEDSGIIKGDYRISDDFTNIECLKTPDTACIRNELKYRDLFVIDTSAHVCKNMVLPTIDFNKYSLLVNRKNTRGNLYFHRNVIVDSINKIITYQISTTSCFCADVCESNNLNIVLVPSISSDYKIIYK